MTLLETEEQYTDNPVAMDWAHHVCEVQEKWKHCMDKVKKIVQVTAQLASSLRICLFTRTEGMVVI